LAGVPERKNGLVEARRHAAVAAKGKDVLGEEVQVWKKYKRGRGISLIPANTV